ncbi:hypothetical protein [Natronolimnobius baerhuensis]|uniref:hypothetical protein n=1 Tax=Natronolimnobius baerhuensis TaxID=253108 RepID=UPI001124FDC5|nr:hypothetical protein [Natronolimnobius baerhuensis]
MNRRKMLSMVGGFGVVGLAGCASSSDEDYNPGDGEYVGEFEEAVSVIDEALEVTSVTTTDSDVDLVYDDGNQDDAALAASSISIIFASLIDDGWNVRQLNSDATVNGDNVLDWYVERDWAETYNDDGHVGNYEDKIYGTMDGYDGPPI